MRHGRVCPALGTGGRAADFSPAGIVECVRRFREPVHIVRGRAGYEPGLGLGGRLVMPAAGADPGYELLGALPALYPEWLGDRSFNQTHGVRFPYVAGEMANGIATVASVVAMARARTLGFFGAAGLALPAVERAVEDLRVHCQVGEDLQAGAAPQAHRLPAGVQLAVAQQDQVGRCRYGGPPPRAGSTVIDRQTRLLRLHD